MIFRSLLSILCAILLSLPVGAQTLGRLTEDLHARDAYAGASSYMDFYHGLALSQEGVDLSLGALLSIDGVVSAGRVRGEDDLKRLYPFPNRIVVLRMTGEEIRKYLEASYDTWIQTVDGPEDPVLRLKSSTDSKGQVKWNFQDSPANFDSAAGVDYTVDITAPSGSRVRIASLAGGRPFLPEAVYGVAITDYRARGSGRLLQAAGIDPKDMEDRIVLRGKEFREILRDCLAERGTLDPAAMRSGSWHFVPEDLAGPGLARDLALVFGTAPYDTRSEIMADLRKAAGEYRMYPSEHPAQTAAPKGYKPFYISHFGRHGARYALGEKVYEEFRDVLEKAHAAGRLTGMGEDLYRRYERLYPHVAYRGGELTQKGQEQHRTIAARMYEDYPAVFKGATHAEVASTASHRVLVSMDAFLDELRRRDRSFDYTLAYGRNCLPAIDPSDSSNPFRKEGRPYPPSVAKKRKRFVEERVDWEEIAGRFCTDLPWLDSLYGQSKFVQTLRKVIVDLPCLDFTPEDRFDDLLTAEEQYRLWQVWNYGGYLYYGRPAGTDQAVCLGMASAVCDLVDRAEEDWAAGTALRLRFTHDSCLLPLLSYLGIDHFGATVSNPYEVENHWRCFEVPMASNLQFIFFRSSHSSDVLVKVLLNGRETTLPFEPVTGPYYSWEEFKRYCRPALTGEGFPTAP